MAHCFCILYVWFACAVHECLCLGSIQQRIRGCALHGIRSRMYMEMKHGLSRLVLKRSDGTRTNTLHYMTGKQQLQVYDGIDDTLSLILCLVLCNPNIYKYRLENTWFVGRSTKRLLGSK
eukprot:212206_1